MSSKRTGLAWAGLVGFLLACGGTAANVPSSPASSPAGSGAGPAHGSACETLATTCHGHDEMSQTARSCHELGHAGDDARCEAKKAECLAACQGKHDAAN